MKLLMTFIIVLTLGLSFTSEKKYVATFTNKQHIQMKEFIQTAGNELLELGWKYYYTTIKHANSNSATIEVVGTNNLMLNPSYCGPISWNNPFPSTTGPQQVAIEAAVASFEQQGFNCICTDEEIVPVPSDGDWMGYRLCVTVTASNTVECPCQI